MLAPFDPLLPFLSILTQFGPFLPLFENNMPQLNMRSYAQILCLFLPLYSFGSSLTQIGSQACLSCFRQLETLHCPSLYSLFLPLSILLAMTVNTKHHQSQTYR